MLINVEFGEDDEAVADINGPPFGVIIVVVGVKTSADLRNLDLNRCTVLTKLTVTMMKKSRIKIKPPNVTRMYQFLVNAAFHEVGVGVEVTEELVVCS